ncbi:MAG: alpha-amylase family glycosyl hydrolase [Imperialibacter sp.]|uniref:alpha-amylase family glycosyl hydrolase n=1 Tax=Imperialibacter sp. TaxID=2038411 RepID=UPI0032EEDC3E
MTRRITLIFLLAGIFSCQTPKKEASAPEEVKAPFLWENATVYFLLTDRFNNGDTTNDVNFGRTGETAPLRGFMGGDIKGINAKISDNYFSDLGVTALWFTPVVEQIHGSVDEGFGNNYGFHGYWAKDWTTLDPNFGTKEDLAALVKAAHAKGIRVVLDVVLNHTGPVTEADPAWADWVRTEPQCVYQDYETTVSCTLVKNLPDLLSGSDEKVELPGHLVEKWKAEGRYEQELAELNEFFERTGYPRAPRYYIIKWLTDYVREFGVDGFRVDTAKHVEESVWSELYKEVLIAFNDWKRSHPNEVLDDNEFYMVGEVYNYGVSGGRWYDFGDRKVDYFDQGFHSLINFEFKYDAQKDYESIFKKYDTLLHTSLIGNGTLNYLSSHDDGQPFDATRERAIEAGTKLLLTPGAAQIYYGDESGRLLQYEGASGDAVLRSFMNWEQISDNASIGDQSVQSILDHWRKLGTFKRDHMAVGVGRHEQISEMPYVFSRIYKDGVLEDRVVIALDAQQGEKLIPVGGVFPDGTQLKDYYSGQTGEVKNGEVAIKSDYNIVLLGPIGT